MKKFLEEILADPQTVENEPATLRQKAGYSLDHGIPDFISDSAYTPPTTPLHDRYGTVFNYREHYKADADFFRYEDQDESSLTRNERRRSRQAVLNAAGENHSLVLDIGCGDGWVAGHFTSRQVNVVSMDLSVTNPLKALDKYPSAHHAAIVADGMQLPFRDESFDLIIASEVIEHLADPALFIRGCMKKLRHHGKLVLVTPYREKIAYHICVHCNKPTPGSAHLHSFNKDNMRELIDPALPVKMDAFCNKYLLKSRLYNLLAFMPFPFWKKIDHLANIILPKPLTLLVTITKT